jgi:hypothetical protein
VLSTTSKEKAKYNLPKTAEFINSRARVCQLLGAGFNGFFLSDGFFSGCLALAFFLAAI